MSDTVSAKQILSIIAHKDIVTCISLAEDGKTFVTVLFLKIKIF